MVGTFYSSKVIILVTGIGKAASVSSPSPRRAEISGPWGQSAEKASSVFSEGDCLNNGGRKREENV